MLPVPTTCGWFIATIYDDFGDGLFEGSLEIKLPTLWTDGKAEVGIVREEKRRGEEERREKVREEKESEERRCRCGER